MKKILLLISIFCCSDKNSIAQVRHYFSYNTIGYYDFNNREKDRILGTVAPSYKVERNRIGIEIFYNWQGIAYYQTRENPLNQKTQPNSIVKINACNIGFAFHYTAFNKKYLKVSPFAGLVKNWYDASIYAFWYGGFEPKFYYEKESKLGLLTGVNINAPIWKGIYANTNARYSFFPTGQYNKQNLVFDFGVGYMYQRKRKKN